MDYNYYMLIALEEAEKAEQIDEVPIGCVIVYKDEIIARGYNRRNKEKNVLAHAEIIAIDKACQKIGDWRLEDCTLFVTVEPCPMCCGAIVQARIKRIVFGCKNVKAGCCGSVLNIAQEQRFNHQVEIVEGIKQEQCSEMMKNFFKKKR